MTTQCYALLWIFVLKSLSVPLAYAQSFSATAIINGDTIAVDSASGTVIVERVPHGGHFHLHFDRRYGFRLSNGARIELRDQAHPRFTGELKLGTIDANVDANSDTQFGACMYYKTDELKLQDSEYKGENMTPDDGSDAG